MNTAKVKEDLEIKVNGETLEIVSKYVFLCVFLILLHYQVVSSLLWNRTLVVEDKLSSTTVHFIRSEGELKNCTLYGF